MRSLFADGSGASRWRLPVAGGREPVGRWGVCAGDSRLRRELRARPRLQGRVLAPAGVIRRLPASGALYFPFYHDVPQRYADGLLSHLTAFQAVGHFVSWSATLGLLDGDTELTAPRFALSLDDGDRTWLDVVLPILSALGIPATFFVVTDAVGGSAGLSWQGCRELVAAGMNIGSHTRTHRPLAALDDATAGREIRDSKSELEDRLGVPVLDFAAPWGRPGLDFLPRDVAIAERAGYRSFATTLRSRMRVGDSALAIRRQGVHPAWPLGAVRTRVHE